MSEGLGIPICEIFLCDMRILEIRVVSRGVGGLRGLDMRGDKSENFLGDVILYPFLHVQT